jgi:hypothetical protein
MPTILRRRVDLCLFACALALRCSSRCFGPSFDVGVAAAALLRGSSSSSPTSPGFGPPIGGRAGRTAAAAAAAAAGLIVATPAGAPPMCGDCFMPPFAKLTGDGAERSRSSN